MKIFWLVVGLALLGLVFTFGCGKDASASDYSSSIPLYVFTEAPFVGEQYSLTVDEGWHVDRGVVTGLRSQFDLGDGFTLNVKDGLILDLVGGLQNQSDSIMPQNTGLGFGVVGNSLDLGIKLSDSGTHMSILLDYQLKNYFITGNNMGYGPEYCTDSNVIMNLKVTAEVRIF